MYCANCGRFVESGWKFCAGCGKTQVDGGLLPSEPQWPAANLTLERRGGDAKNEGRVESRGVASPGIGYWMLLPIKRWSDYRGRSRRKEYWSFSAFAALTLLVVIAFRAIAGDQDGAMADVGTVLVLAALVVFIPASIAAQVRRWHDRDVTGWACLISFIPYIGGIIVLIYMCMRGTKGPNRFGPDPTELS